MSETFDVKYSATNIGVIATAIQPLFKNIGKNGAITVLEANLLSSVAGTTISDLIYYSGTDAAGTGAKGTICTFGSPATGYSAGSATILSAVVPANNWVSVQNRLGTTAAVTVVEVAYVNGR